MVTFIALSGFLGAGKTTTMIQCAARVQQAGHRVAVITNDQGIDLVDTATVQAKIAAVGEVTGGCFCCRFEDLLGTTQRLVAEQSADVVIAESVGSCTDLTATVLRPLRQLYGDRFAPAPLTTVVDPLRFRRFEAAWAKGETETDLMYLYRKQLQDADVIAVNKIDLLDNDEIDAVVAALRVRFQQAMIVTYSAAAQRGLDDLVQIWLGQHTDTGRDLTIDYIRYGVAEARLAWVNQTFELSAPAGATCSLVQWTRQVLADLGQSCHDLGYIIGHIKVMVTSEQGMLRASLIDSSQDALVEVAGLLSTERGWVILNARVECEPDELEMIVTAAVRTAAVVQHMTLVSRQGQSFKPKQPVPVYRLFASV